MVKQVSQGESIMGVGHGRDVTFEVQPQDALTAAEDVDWMDKRVGG